MNPPTICKCGLAKSYHGTNAPNNSDGHEYEPRYDPESWREGYREGAASRPGWEVFTAEDGERAIRRATSREDVDLRRAFMVLARVRDDEVDDLARRLIDADARTVQPWLAATSPTEHTGDEP